VLSSFTLGRKSAEVAETLEAEAIGSMVLTVGFGTMKKYRQELEIGSLSLISCPACIYKLIM
jgi:hypothetical protein